MNSLEKQYDRLIEQMREEVSELYWLYNFFFIADATLLGYMVKELPDKKNLLAILGLLFSILWFSIFDKQRRCRNKWICKIMDVEEELAIPKHVRFFQKGFEGSGIATTLKVLPFGFGIFWLLYLGGGYLEF